MSARPVRGGSAANSARGSPSVAPSPTPRLPFRPTSALRMGVVGDNAFASPFAALGDGVIGGGAMGKAGAFLPHSPSAVAFTLLPEHREPMAYWLGDAKSFLGGNPLANESESIPPSVTSINSPSLASAALSAVVKLLPNLAHHRAEVRSGTMHLLLRLGEVFGQSAGANSARWKQLLKTQTNLLNKKVIVTEESKDNGAPASQQPPPVAISKDEQKRLERETRHDAIVSFTSSSDEGGLFHLIGTFFSLMGPTLTPMVLAIVDRLEKNYLHPNAAVRDASILISANLITMHSSLFVVEDQLVAVWNLFFLLDLLSGGHGSSRAHHAVASAGGGPASLARFDSTTHSEPSLTQLVQSLPLSGTRLSIIQSLGVLVQLYVPNHVSLTMQIVARLIQLSEKSDKEVLAIKSALLSISNAALEVAHKPLTEEDTKSKKPKSGTATPAASLADFDAMPTPPSPLQPVSSLSNAPADSQSLLSAYSLYPVFLSCLTAHQEEHYDVLGWIVFAYTLNLQSTMWNQTVVVQASKNKQPLKIGASATTGFEARELLTRREEIDELFYELHHSADRPASASSSSASHASKLRFSERYPHELLHAPEESVVLPVELAELLPALEKHLRASPPLIRFGAAQSLSAVLRVYPSALAWSRPLFAHILWGLMDEHPLTARVYQALLSVIARGAGDERLREMLVSYAAQFEEEASSSLSTTAQRSITQNTAGRFGRHDRQNTIGFSLLSPLTAPTATPNTALSSSPSLLAQSLLAYPSSDELAAADAATTSSANTGVNLDTVLERAILLAPTIPSRFLGYILSSIALAPYAMQVRQLKLVRAWAHRLKEVDALFVQKLLPLLVESHAASQSLLEGDEFEDLEGEKPTRAALAHASEVPSLVVDIFRSLASQPIWDAALHVVDPAVADALFHGLGTYFAATLEAASSAMDEGEGEGSEHAGAEATDASRTNKGKASSSAAATTQGFAGIESAALEQRVISALDSLSYFPLERLPAVRRDGILSSCVNRLALHPSKHVRASLYKMVRTSSRLWSSKYLLSKAAGVALLGLGDTDSQNVLLAHQSLEHLVSAMNFAYGQEKDGRHDILLEQLRKHKSDLSSPSLLHRLHAYDELARCFMQHSGEQQQISLFSLRDCVMGNDFKEFVIRLYSDVSLSHHTTALHAHWWSLLCSHCGQLIRRRVPVMLLSPLLKNEDRQIRAATCHAIKRACVLSGNINDRLIQDIVTTLPTLLNISATTTTATGAPVIATTSSSASNFEQESGFYLMHILIPLKIRGFNSFLTHQFFSATIDALLHPHLAFFVRRTMMLFLESVILVHPRLAYPYLETLRNNIRELLCHVQGSENVSRSGGYSSSGASSNQLNLISRLYSLIVYTATKYGELHAAHQNPFLKKQASANDAVTAPKIVTLGNQTAMGYYMYLKRDLAALGGAEEHNASSMQGVGSGARSVDSSYDPLLSKLNSGQLRLVTLVTIQAIGCIESMETARAVADELVPFLAHADAQIRYFAVEALNNQLRFLSPQSSAFARWALLPLLADADVAVRVVVNQSVIGPEYNPTDEFEVPSPQSNLLLKRRIALMPPEELDYFSSSSIPQEGEDSLPPEEAFELREKRKVEKAAIASATFNLAPSTPLDAAVPAQLSRIDTEEPFYACDENLLVPDARQYPQPLISPAFFVRIETIVREKIDVFPPEERFEELMYHMQQLFKLQSTAAATALVLAEICTFVADKEDLARPIMKLLLLQLDCSLNTLTRSLVFGCVLAIQSICCHRASKKWAPTAMVFEYFSQLSLLREGDLVALRSITNEPKLDMKAVVSTEQVNAVTEKIVSTLQNDRTSTLSKQIALEILASLCLKVNLENVSSIIDFIFGMLDSSSDADFHEVCGAQLSKLFSSLPLDHPLLETFTIALSYDVKSSRLESRLRALTTLVILQTRLPYNTRCAYFLRLLADPNREVKHHTLAVLLNPQLSNGFDQMMLPVVKQMLKEVAVEEKRAAMSKKPSVLKARPTTSAIETTAPMEELNDQQLLRLLDDVTDAYHRRAQQDAADNLPQQKQRSNFAAGPNASASYSILNTQGAPAPLQSQSIPDSSKPLFEIPLKETDPFNLRYLQSPPFLHLLRCYGMNRLQLNAQSLMAKQKDAYTAFQQLTSNDPSALVPLPMNPEIEENLPTLLDRLSPAKRGDLFADIRAKQAAHQDFSPLIAALLHQDHGREGDFLLKELLQTFQTLLPPPLRNGVSTKAERDATVDGVYLNMEDKLHSLGVIMNLLQAFNYSTSPTGIASHAGNVSVNEREQLQSKLNNSLEALQNSSTQFKNHAESLRSKTFQALSELQTLRGPHSGTHWHTSIRNESAFQRRQHYLKTMMAPPGSEAAASVAAAQSKTNTKEKDEEKKSTSEVALNLPNTKQGLLELGRSLERRISAWGLQLSHTTLLQTKIIQCVSKLLLKSDAQFDHAALIKSYTWLNTMFVDSHRGVREAVREGIVSVCGYRLSPQFADANQPASPILESGDAAAKRGETFLSHVQKSIFGVFKALKDPVGGAASTLSGSASSSSLHVVGSEPAPTTGIGSATTPEWFNRRRPRADLIFLLCHLISYSSNSKLRQDVVDLFIQMWDDSDSVVRSHAVDAIQLLIKSNYFEIAAYVKHKDANKSSPLMKAILQRVRDVNWRGDREKLNQLLSWYFSNAM